MYKLIPPSCRLEVARYVQVAHARDMTKLMSHVALACPRAYILAAVLIFEGHLPVTACRAMLRNSGLPSSQPNLIKLYMTCLMTLATSCMYKQL